MGVGAGYFFDESSEFNKVVEVLPQISAAQAYFDCGDV